VCIFFAKAYVGTWPAIRVIRYSGMSTSGMIFKRTKGLKCHYPFGEPTKTFKPYHCPRIADCPLAD
jgi:hypothetical protein